MTMTRLLSAAVVGACVLALAAVPAVAQPSTQRNLVQTAASAGQFKTLVMLVQRAGLAQTLQKPGPYTVFAPTDAAFKKVPKATLSALLADKAKLRSVLLYHVVAGKVTAAAAAKLSSAKTLDGERVRIRATSAGVFVNTAKVVKPDVMASNGVIHVINSVLIPPAR
jgi:uncharacterized surface protein with fasciclin (FAS1) repeats